MIVRLQEIRIKQPSAIFSVWLFFRAFRGWSTFFGGPLVVVLDLIRALGLISVRGLPNPRMGSIIDFVSPWPRNRSSRAPRAPRVVGAQTPHDVPHAERERTARADSPPDQRDTNSCQTLSEWLQTGCG